MALLHLYIGILTVVCSFPMIIGGISLAGTSAVDIDHGEDGEQFVEKIVHGDIISHKPGHLVFTAPYRLCEGGCENSDTNFAMDFPLYVGDKGKEVYKKIFQRDFKNLHAEKENAPFKLRTPSKLDLKQQCMTRRVTPLQKILTTPVFTEPETTELITTPTTTEMTTITTTTDDTTITETVTETLPTSMETYITNTNGVRCPRRKPRCIERGSGKRVTAEIAFLDPMDYYAHINRAKIDSIALDSLYFE